MYSQPDVLQTPQNHAFLEEKRPESREVQFEENGAGRRRLSRGRSWSYRLRVCCRSGRPQAQQSEDESVRNRLSKQQRQLRNPRPARGADLTKLQKLKKKLQCKLLVVEKTLS